MRRIIRRTVTTVTTVTTITWSDEVLPAEPETSVAVGPASHEQPAAEESPAPATNDEAVQGPEASSG